MYPFIFSLRPIWHGRPRSRFAGVVGRGNAGIGRSASRHSSRAIRGDGEYADKTGTTEDARLVRHENVVDAAG